jgi:ribonuclease inhibitor
MAMRKRRLRRCVIEGSAVDSLEDVYVCLDRKFKFPKQFGRTLDALYDCLSTDVEGPFEIVLQAPEKMRANLDPDYLNLLKVLIDVVEERDDASLVLRSGD